MVKKKFEDITRRLFTTREEFFVNGRNDLANSYTAHFYELNNLVTSVLNPQLLYTYLVDY